MSKKYTFCAYQLYENEALKDQLEAMALKGWRLTRIGSLLLHFESCEPHPIRYCVEVMEKPSMFASNQTLPLRRYREFCKDAGWSYLGSNGLLHIFYTEDMEALPVETDDQERYEHICRAYSGSYRMIAVMFALLSALNLFTCYQQGTIFSSNGMIVLILLLTIFYYGGDYFLWKRKARRSIEVSQALPTLSWKTARLKNLAVMAGIMLLAILYLLYTLEGQLSPLVVKVLLIYLVIYCLTLALFSWLIHWLREKNTFSARTNIAIYFGAAILLILLIIGIGSRAISFL